MTTPLTDERVKEDSITARDLALSDADHARLKSCPYCGGEAEIVQIGNEVTPKRGFEVRCLTWGCSTKKRAMVIRQPLEKARGFAVAAWNTRAEPAALLKEIEGLRGALAQIMAGLARGDVSGEDVVWFSTIETLWEFCATALDPENELGLDAQLQATDPALILAALSSKAAPHD